MMQQNTNFSGMDDFSNYNPTMRQPVGAAGLIQKYGPPRTFESNPLPPPMPFQGMFPPPPPPKPSPFNWLTVILLMLVIILIVFAVLNGLDIFPAHNNYVLTNKSKQTIDGSLTATLFSTGSLNTLIGNQAGGTNTNTAYKFDTFIGVNSGLNNSRGNGNSFIGDSSGRSNTDGDYNTFLGYNSGYANKGGGNNTFIGKDSGYGNTEGDHNTFVGLKSGSTNGSGYYNTFIGSNAGLGNTGANNNTFVGYNSGSANTIGTRNTFLGTNSGLGNVGATDNTFLGYNAGSNLNSSSSNKNIAIGSGAGPTGTYAYTNSFWLPNDVAPIGATGSPGPNEAKDSSTYLLAFDSSTGRVFPISAGKISYLPSQLP